MRLSVLIGALMMGLIAAPSAAHAKDLSGRFAIGGQQNSLGQQGLSVKYWVGHLGFNVLFGGSSIGTKAAWPQEINGQNSTVEGQDTVRSVDSALRVLFNAARAKDVNMYVGGGIGVGSVSKDVGDPAGKDTSATEVGLELFLGAEYFFSNHFAVQAEVGVPIRAFVGNDGPALGGLAGAASDGDSYGFFTPTTWASGFSFYF